jgi:hypothetical protein
MDTGPSSERLSLEEVEARLRELPELEVLGLLRRSSNYTFLTRLGPEPRLLAVYKPAAGESPLWDFESGSLYRREVAAYELAKFLGWPLVPPTVVRERGPHGVGALQLFIDADLDRHYFQADGILASTWEEVAVFDFLANNADRKSGHCLADSEGRVWVIDHGLTFHVETKLRTVIWDFAGRPLPARLRGDLERLGAELEPGGRLRARLEELLAGAELGALQRRLTRALGDRWRYPQPSSAWSMPWPPV